MKIKRNISINNNISLFFKEINDTDKICSDNCIRENLNIIFGLQYKFSKTYKYIQDLENYLKYINGSDIKLPSYFIDYDKGNFTFILAGSRFRQHNISYNPLTNMLVLPYIFGESAFKCIHPSAYSEGDIKCIQNFCKNTSYAGPIQLHIFAGASEIYLNNITKYLNTINPLKYITFKNETTGKH
ncbi:MAG: hypothetical protein [Wendovervirus sonii]|uniref:Uncharacterized protein n=1 Tax=phage Lak_Megaphage_Sonny TaxID=3109229 RepID=A0ABZ0Z2D8_9CAUD|nr:MAG: hypothetical protein [phage Lak_Megaphage_Sonny]